LKVVSDLHAPEFTKKRPVLKSTIEPTSLDDFMALAEMSKKKFDVERQTEIVSEPTIIVKGGEISLVKGFASTYVEYAKNPSYKPLKIPRRPQWTTEMTAEELDTLEKQAFVGWRTEIA
jgi:large subunit GTPase 1